MHMRNAGVTSLRWFVHQIRRRKPRRNLLLNDFRDFMSNRNKQEYIISLVTNNLLLLSNLVAADARLCNSADVEKEMISSSKEMFERKDESRCNGVDVVSPEDTPDAETGRKRGWESSSSHPSSKSDFWMAEQQAGLRHNQT